MAFATAALFTVVADDIAYRVTLTVPGTTSYRESIAAAAAAALGESHALAVAIDPAAALDTV